MLSYNDVFLEAWQRVLSEFEKKKIQFYSESDIICHIFHCCLESMENSNFKRPFDIHAEVQPYPYKINAWADLVLGSNEVVVEAKFLNRFESAVTMKRDEAKKDVEKLGEYVRLGAKHAYFIFADEQGHCKRYSPWNKLHWTSLKTDDEESHFLILKVVMDEKSKKILILSEPEFRNRA